MENVISNQPQGQIPKRNIAFKYRIGSILGGKPILENERLKFLEIESKQIVRINIIANVIEKFVQEGERKFASITIDDGSGQIKAKLFGDDVEKFFSLQQGDTAMIIGLLKYWNNEVYLAPEIIKKKDPLYLLLRKLEVESEQPIIQDPLKVHAVRDRLINMLKGAEKENSSGLEIENIILDLKENPSLINQEIKKLMEDGLAFEPRPGRLRWLG
ncbi:MAG: OB-fold nucleic acid binding domain-containing protein [Nanoarchaeota archaeon]